LEKKLANTLFKSDIYLYTMKKVFCFGELLLRFSPNLQKQWIQEHSMPVFVGGAELNVAKALAAWQTPVKYVSALPDNYISKEIIDSLQDTGIDSSAILLNGDRIGTYTLPMGADLKNAGVIYDRAYSSFSFLKRGMIDWEQVLDGYDWFHFTAISPALNTDIAALCEEALQFASKKGMKISVDLNYRAKLWQYGKRPVDIMPSLVKYCHVVMGNVWSAHQLLGTTLDAALNSDCSKEMYIQQAELVSKEIMATYPACSLVANTYRFSEADAVRYYATLTNQNDHVVSKEHYTETVVDKVGSGDCFMAGLIYATLQNFRHQEIIHFAASAAFGKLQEIGDSTKQSINNIQSRY
jgi:2-dehydro-3-deoxygluconokinase